MNKAEVGKEHVTMQWFYYEMLCYVDNFNTAFSDNDISLILRFVYLLINSSFKA